MHHEERITFILIRQQSLECTFLCCRSGCSIRVIKWKSKIGVWSGPYRASSAWFNVMDRKHWPLKSNCVVWQRGLTCSESRCNFMHYPLVKCCTLCPTYCGSPVDTAPISQWTGNHPAADWSTKRCDCSEAARRNDAALKNVAAYDGVPRPGACIADFNNF